MNIFGYVINNKKNIIIDGRNIKLNRSFAFIKGSIFNLNDILNKYLIDVSDNVNDNILKLYENVGLEFISLLDGDFAIVIYDYSNDKFYLIKDKLGGVFLYYYYDLNKFIFSTSLKMIEEKLGKSKKVDIQVLSNLLGYTYIYEPYTIFENTFKVGKGSIVSYKDNDIFIDKYYSLDDRCLKSKTISTTEDELIKEYENLFLESIGKRGNKKSQVAVFLSSGRDSSLLAAMANKVYDKKVRTYTLGFENERDESAAASKIADYIGSDHHTITLKDEDAIKVIYDLIKYYDEPCADPSIVPFTYLINNIKDKNDFYLTGDGNDAIFVSSSMYSIYDFKPRVKMMFKKIINIYNHKRVYKNFDELAQNNIITRFNYSDRLTGCRGKVFKLNKKLSKRRISVLGDLNNIVSERNKVKIGSIMNNYNYKYFTPYYDISILEKSFNTPINYLYQNKEGKYIYNKVLEKYVPNKYFENYKKNGFGIPVVKWVKNYILDEIIKISEKDFIEKQGIFVYDNLYELINGFKNDNEYSKALVLWNYFIFQLWYKEHMM